MTGDNRLPVLASQIERNHVLAVRAGREFVRHAIDAGRLLIEAKNLVPHGEWVGWLAEHVPNVSPRTCQRYMKAATMAGKSDTCRFSSLRYLVRPRKRQPFAELERVLAESQQLETEAAALRQRLEAAESGPTTIAELQAIIAESRRIQARSAAIRAIAGGEYAKLTGEAVH